MYKLTNKIFNKIINICNKKGCPNIYGLIIHSILFFILVYFFINLKEGIPDSPILTSSEEGTPDSPILTSCEEEGIPDSPILTSSEESINSYNRNNKSESHTHDISFSDTCEYAKIYNYINSYLTDSEDFKDIINNDNFKDLLSDYENLEALSCLLNKSYNTNTCEYNRLYGLLNSRDFSSRLSSLNAQDLEWINNNLKN